MMAEAKPEGHAAHLHGGGNQLQKIKEHWGVIVACAGVTFALLTAYATVFIDDRIKAAPARSEIVALQKDVGLAKNDAEHNKETLDRLVGAVGSLDDKVDRKFEKLTDLIMERMRARP